MNRVLSVQKIARNFILVLGLMLFLTGCFHHQIAFQDVHYIVPSKQYSEKVVAVIDADTLKKEVSIHSGTAGWAHYWDAQPGQMLKQVADVELPQIFKEYHFDSTYEKNNISEKTIILEMFITNYRFADFAANISVRIIAHGDNNKTIFDNVYIGEGGSKAGKVLWTGAFGMKSAIRQSSLEAYQKIFTALREDLRKTLASEKAPIEQKL